jgi:hypothetical protein
MLAFAESYYPLPTAYTDTNNYDNNHNNNKNNDFKTNSIPLYGVINGFYVNKTGDYNKHFLFGGSNDRIFASWKAKSSNNIMRDHH